MLHKLFCALMSRDNMCDKCTLSVIASGSTLNFQKSQDLVMKNPRIEQNSQAILKTQENSENENNFTFTNIELLTDRIRIWKSGDNVNSKSDIIPFGLIVLDLWSQPIRCQNYTQNFISLTTVTNPKIARQNPQIPRSGGESQAVRALVFTCDAARNVSMYNFKLIWLSEVLTNWFLP